MWEANARFVGTIPEHYDRHLGPVIFEPFAEDLARRVPVAPTAPVLEVACGTGPRDPSPSASSKAIPYALRSRSVGSSWIRSSTQSQLSCRESAATNRSDQPCRRSWSLHAGRQRIGVVMPSATSPKAIASSLIELWSPRIIAEVDDAYVKVAKVQGSLAWHSHDNEDELFLILEGRLRIEMEGGDVNLDEGEMFVVPKGVRHNPVAEQECLLLLIERKSTQHTGDVVIDKTRSLVEQLRPL
jgi:mannose-6-phosphate isomerase-like protein (cupin superfamily)